MAAPRQAPALHWCFTLNNPGEGEDELSICEELERFGITYAVFQLEAGENGTPHFQGYVAFSEKQRLTAIRTLMNGRAHWEKCKGSPAQNKIYCTKPDGRIGEFCEIGKFPENHQGKRTDLADLHSALNDGLTQHEYATQYFDVFLRYPNLVQNYQLAGVIPRTDGEPLSSWLLIGPPGTGKSRFAREICTRLGDGRFYRHCIRKWFDGYLGERTILFDDFCGSSLPFTDFKCILDRYAVRVELKGTSCPLAAVNFVITTNDDPKSWWKAEVTGAHGHSAIFRRIGVILAFVAENQFRVYRSYDDYWRDLLRPHRDGETFNPTSPLKTIRYEEGGVEYEEEILQAQI